MVCCVIWLRSTEAMKRIMDSLLNTQGYQLLHRNEFNFNGIKCDPAAKNAITPNNNVQQLLRGWTWPLKLICKQTDITHCKQITSVNTHAGVVGTDQARITDKWNYVKLISTVRQTMALLYLLFNVLHFICQRSRILFI